MAEHMPVSKFDPKDMVRNIASLMAKTSWLTANENRSFATSVQAV